MRYSSEGYNENTKTPLKDVVDYQSYYAH